MKKKGAYTNHRLTLTERAYKFIKRAILSGEIEGGKFLSESDFRRERGIGRTPFREACNRLHHEQILEVVPRHGYFVPTISVDGARALFEARMLVEGVVAELAVAKASSEQIDELERLLRPNCGELKVPSDLREAVIAANTEFHLCLARLTGNPELVRLVTGLLERTNPISYMLTGIIPNAWSDHEREHAPVVEALRKRDPLAARKAVANDLASGSYINVERISSIPKSSYGPPLLDDDVLPRPVSLPR